MEQLLGKIPITFSDSVTNSLFHDLDDRETAYTRHFTQNEEFMLRLPTPYTVPSCPIHHDYRRTRPGDNYLRFLRTVTEQLGALLPSVFGQLNHIFDPAEIFRPAFFRLYTYNSRSYLYLVRLDLTHRPALHEVVTRGDNDRSAAYRSNAVILETDMVPLEGTETSRGRLKSVTIEQSVSQTWIGETGRGYFVQGIWLDRDLTKFFSKLFVPPGVRSYPYFPVTCKYRAICHSVVTLDDAARRKSLPLFERARSFLLPHLRDIEAALRSRSFTEQMPLFRQLRQSVPAEWMAAWEAFSVKAYLNDDGQREYLLEHGIV